MAVDRTEQIVTVSVKFCAGNREEPLGEVEVPFPFRLGPVTKGADANDTAYVPLIPDSEGFRARLVRALEAFSAVFNG
ncbi:hypothetical protein [Bifidobacterium cuniculi]|uniref:Uncharacterized protein n=1 Tax=Bifidobacterium cuniculi TaxID=1688 RepID=A0A087AFH8_9BIFI|nr:hypothetical protein [Bifidobacterium cuniculi]KFI57528.1 hypothetical protein BCUN_1876 [Bifidobacterium cuniculi]